MNDFLQRMRVPLIILIIVFAIIVVLLGIFIGRNLLGGTKDVPRLSDTGVDAIGYFDDSASSRDSVYAPTTVTAQSSAAPREAASDLDALVDAPPRSLPQGEPAVAREPRPRPRADSTRRARIIEAPNEADASPIKHFLIDYDKRYATDLQHPLLITVASETPTDAKFVSVRVYARRVSDTREMISRDLIFSMPKIFALDGRTQTQFYWAGKKFEGDALRSGQYLLYVEMEYFDANDDLIDVAARYPEPRWERIVLVK